MRIVLGIAMMILSGCSTTGYVFGGLGYAHDVRIESFDETGTVGTYGVGLKFNDYLRCEFRHRSMVNQKPEIVTDDTMCIGTIYLWGH